MDKQNREYEAIILKGVASQLLQMNKPTLQQAFELFNAIGMTITTTAVFDATANKADKYQYSANMYRTLVNELITQLEHRELNEDVAFYTEKRRKIDSSL
jgi:4-diphosphocytidyl-2C-methyl-D-erythritol kinase